VYVFRLFRDNGGRLGNYAAVSIGVSDGESGNGTRPQLPEIRRDRDRFRASLSIVRSDPVSNRTQAFDPKPTKKPSSSRGPSLSIFVFQNLSLGQQIDR
jgi:hypothetical protein